MRTLTRQDLAGLELALEIVAAPHSRGEEPLQALRRLIARARASGEGSAAETELQRLAEQLREAGAVTEVVGGTDPFDAGIGAALKLIERRLEELRALQPPP
ncbi:hypothetical protein [Pseudomonas sp. zfem005]|uniref:hypothetical protein n=1 Tax=Pseudomonas sp. zfem005 TaxID=3078200 RepID=UPI00292A0159|nr:hypothetical protein [Pseudomonas sp. zfem005]MDU9414253.1 hypothetical protein [Pseudomonas sp. zfem005]